MAQMDRLGRKVYGPYGGPGKRKMVSWFDPDGRHRGTTYAKWLMEEHLGRELGYNETVDHINRDFTDDRFENLRLVPRSQHCREDARHVKPVEVVCVWCGTKVWRKASILDSNAKQGKSGPFCSRHCSGEYGMYLRAGGKKLERVPSPPKEYYYMRKGGSRNGLFDDPEASG